MFNFISTIFTVCKINDILYKSSAREIVTSSQEVDVEILVPYARKVVRGK